jgi:hypothetical protein
MRDRTKATTNDIFEEYAKKGARLTVRKLDKGTVLVEGDRTALEFLGNLLIAYARSNEHAVQVSPNGAGMNRFSEESTLGFYLHRLPCGDKTHDGRHVRRVTQPLRRG